MDPPPPVRDRVNKAEIVIKDLCFKMESLSHIVKEVKAAQDLKRQIMDNT